MKIQIYQNIFCHDQESFGKCLEFFLFVTQFTDVLRHHEA